MGHFLPFDPSNNLKNQSFKKMKKALEDIILLHLHVANDDHMIYAPEIWSTTEFFVILDCFLPFNPPNNPEYQNFEKMKKMPEDIIILHICTINENMCGF